MKIVNFGLTTKNKSEEDLYPQLWRAMYGQFDLLVWYSIYVRYCLTIQNFIWQMTLYKFIYNKIQNINESNAEFVISSVFVYFVKC